MLSLPYELLQAIVDQVDGEPAVGADASQEDVGDTDGDGHDVDGAVAEGHDVDSSDIDDWDIDRADVNRQTNLKALCLVDKILGGIAQKALYRDIGQITTQRSAISFCRTILKRPDLATSVRRLGLLFFLFDGLVDPQSQMPWTMLQLVDPKAMLIPGWTRLIFRTMRCLTSLKASLWASRSITCHDVLPQWFYQNLCSCTFQLKALDIGHRLGSHSQFLDQQPSIQEIYLLDSALVTGDPKFTLRSDSLPNLQTFHGSWDGAKNLVPGRPVTDLWLWSGNSFGLSSPLDFLPIYARSTGPIRVFSADFQIFTSAEWDGIATFLPHLILVSLDTHAVEAHAGPQIQNWFTSDATLEGLKRLKCLERIWFRMGGLETALDDDFVEVLTRWSNAQSALWEVQLMVSYQARQCQVTYARIEDGNGKLSWSRARGDTGTA